MARRARRARKRSSGFMGRALYALLLLMGGLLLVSAALVGALRYVAPPFTAMMLVQDVPLRSQRHVWVSRDAISSAAAHAVIASEDQRFLEHNGFDIDAIRQAVEEYLEGGDLRGASTISQQVAKNLFLWPGRSFARKGIEAYFTLLIEVLWPKERILEVYLNVAELGEGVFGVESAARAYFSATASSLSAEQAALLAAVLPNPKGLHVDRPSDYVLRRQAWIVGQMRTLSADGRYRALQW